MPGVNNRRELEALSDAEKQRRKAGLAAVARARRKKTTIPAAIQAERAAGHEVSLADVLAYAREAVRRDARGRLVPTVSDSIYRRIPFLTTRDVREVDTWSSREASLIGEYKNSLKAYDEGYDSRGAGIRRFRGKTAGAQEFQTDLDKIDAWLRRDERELLNQEGS